MKLVLSITAGIILAFFLLIAGCTALVASSSSTSDPDFKKATTSASQSSVSESEPEAEGTTSQQNAVETAESYLSHSNFSRKGLIEQLKYEGYSRADAVYAVDQANPDWNEQAAGAAKSYLDHSSFSRSGLIEQLEYEGYTHAQAVYGVSTTGL